MTDNTANLKTVTLPSGGVVTFEDISLATKPTDAEKKADAENIARSWRNGQLEMSDWIIPLTDHPQNASYITYRKALRDWPSTADFPDKRPTL